MDYIPRKRAERLLWWQNLKDQIATEGPKFGLAAPAIAEVDTLATAMITLYQETNAAENALNGKRLAEKDGQVIHEANIRAKVRNWKTLPNWNASGSAGVLKLAETEPDFDPGSYKPEIKVKMEGGFPRLEFIKRGVDAIIIYTRLRGEMGWTKLARDSASPYIDTRPLANPDVPETREYMAMGELDDEEIGIPSEIASIVVG